MEKINLKKESPKTRAYIKKRIIAQFKKGVKPGVIAETFGIAKQYVYNLHHVYKKMGASCIKEKTQGRKLGEQRLLNDKQEREIQKIIIDKHPEQMKLNCMLWTRTAVSQLIKDKYGIKIPVRTISEYLKRWGLTCQRPTKKAYFQDNVNVKDFMDKTYPEIAKKAAKEDVVIYWGDETGVNNQEYHVRGFSSKGITPVVPSYSKRETVNMISAITNQGSCRFMCYKDNMNQDKFIDFMKRLISESDRKVFLIVDNLRVHHEKKVAAWVEKHSSDIELFFTSPYSPEINPDEYLNHNLKMDVHSGILPRTADDIQSKIQSFMRRLQHNKNRVINIFKHKNLSYIAAAEC